MSVEHVEHYYVGKAVYELWKVSNNLWKVEIFVSQNIFRDSPTKKLNKK